MTFPYVARIIMPEGVGTISFVDSMCRYLMLFAALGIPIYGVREIAKVKNDSKALNSLFSELVVIHLFLTVFILVIFLLAINFIPQLHSNQLYYFTGAFMILSNVFIVEWYFQGIEQFQYITIRNLIIRTLSTVAVFVFIKKKDDVLIYYSILVIVWCLNAIINFIYAKRQITFDFSFNFRLIRRHFVPLIYIFSSIAFISVYTLLDTIMLGFMSGSRSVGLYSTGLKIAKIPMMFLGALSTVLIPKLSEHYHLGKNEEFRIIIDKSIKFIVTFGVPIIFIILGFSEKIVLMFAGNEFINSYIVLNILSGLGLLIGISSVFGLQVLTPMSKDKYLTYSVAIGTIISLFSNIILIPRLNEVGAAISNILAEIGVTVSTIYFSSKFFKISIDYKFLILTVFFSIPFYFISKFLIQLIENFGILLMLYFFICTLYFVTVQLFIMKNELIVDLKNQLFK